MVSCLHVLTLPPASSPAPGASCKAQVLSRWPPPRRWGSRGSTVGRRPAWEQSDAPSRPESVKEVMRQDMDPGAALPLPPPCRQRGGAPAPGWGRPLRARPPWEGPWGPTGTRFSPRISAAFDSLPGILFKRCTPALGPSSNVLSSGLASRLILLAVHETVVVSIVSWRTRSSHARPHL